MFCSLRTASRRTATTPGHWRSGDHVSPVQTGDPDRDSSRMISVDVTDVFIHPGYLPLTVEETYGLEPYDVALLELSEPVVLDRYLRLPTRSPRAGESVIVAGWGATETGLPSTVLREAVLTVKMTRTAMSATAFGSARWATPSTATSAPAIAAGRTYLELINDAVQPFA